MREINAGDTAMLLAELDSEIEAKCSEIKEKQQDIKLKKIFFSGCIGFVFIFLLQIFFQIFNINSLLVMFIFQVVVLAAILPVAFNLNRGGIIK